MGIFHWGRIKQILLLNYKQLKNVTKDVKMKKFRTEDGQCIIVDLRRITGDSQNPIVSENYLIKEKRK